MTLTRKQELTLIDLGLKQIINNLTKPKKRGPYKKEKKVKGRKWSAQQRKRFVNTMRKVWAKKRNNGKTI